MKKMIVVTILIVVPTISLQVRRYHDAGLSGKWFLLLILIGLGVWGVYFWFAESASADSPASDFYPIVGITSIIFGVLLFVVDNFCLRIKNLNSLNYLSSLIIGFSQCLALIPGVSRSGSIVTAMRYFGFQRKFAVYYSNLLSIPAILSATGYLLITNFDQISTTSIISLYGITILFFSFIFSIAFIYFFVAWTRNFSFLIFAVYRVIFGIGLIFFFYFQF